MSKRVTTETEIKDRSIAMDAFRAANVQAREITADTFEVRAGRSVGTLNLRTGQIVGDDMSFTAKDFEPLKQHYAERKYLWELTQRGASVHSRNVEQNGDIVIVYQIA